MTAQRAVLGGIVIHLSALALVFGYFGYPPASMNDGAWFMVPGIRFAETGEFVNPIRWLDSKLDGGNGLFLSYPPLFPLVVSWFVAPNAEPAAPLQAMKGMALLIVIALVLSGWALYSIATADGAELDWATTVLISVALCMVLHASWNFGTRPEMLVRVFFTLGLVLALVMPEPRRLATVFGALIGLTAATHVIAPVFLAALVGMFFAWRYDLRRGIGYLAIAGMVSIVSFVAVVQFAPVPVGDMISGTLRHGSAMVSRLTPGGIVAAFAGRPFYLFAGLIVAAFAGQLFYRKMRSGAIASPALFIISAFAATVYVAFAAANVRNYYLTPFLVLVFIPVLRINREMRHRVWARYALVTGMIALALAWLIPVVLFPLFLRDGMTLPAARAAFADVLAEHPDVPFMPGGSRMWMLSEAYDQMFVAEIPARPGAPRYLLVTEEWESPDLQGKYDGCVLEREFYVSRPPEVLGIRLAHAVPGYGFAVYDCGVPDVR
jgi:hypothetical protein